MNNTNKEQMGCDVICRSHSARTERDLYRICPSKLSKRELEDLYFALLENNLDLKKTIHTQQDKIKVLSTKVQRMTVVQRNAAGKEKDCCASKVLANEQKESISELKKANERMADRIRLLNMRLCSAKQFLKRSPAQTSKCVRCATAPATFKNSSMGALHAKLSDASVRNMTAVSCQCLFNKIGPHKATRTVETETDLPEKEDMEKHCDENKCRSLMDELKQKIVNLQEELSKTHSEYAARITKLENDVSELHGENIRVRSDNVASEHAIQQRVKRAEDLSAKLRQAESRCNELTLQLTIERRKVAELETSLRLANMSNQVAQSIEHLTTLTEAKEVSQMEKLDSSSKQLEVPTSSSKLKEDLKASKSDDSGCMDLNKSCDIDDDKGTIRLNQELLEKIADLQTQLDTLRVNTAGASKRVTLGSKQYSYETDDVDVKDVDGFDTKTGTNIIIEIEEYDVKLNTQYSDNEPEASTPIEQRDHQVAAQEYDNQQNEASQPWAEDIHLSNKDTKVTQKAEDTIKFPSSTTIIETDKVEPKTSTGNEDDMRYQIPGPIPAIYPSIYNKKGKDSKKKGPEEKSVTIYEDRKGSIYSNEPADERDSIMLSMDKPSDSTQKDTENQYKDSENLGPFISQVYGDKNLSADSIFIHRRKLNAGGKQNDGKDKILESEAHLEEVEKASTSFEHQNSTAFVIPVTDSKCSEKDSKCPNVDDGVAVEKKAGIVEETLLDGTTDEYATLVNLNPSATQGPSNPSVPPVEPARRDSATFTKPNTYTVESARQERAASPENTEHEISSLSDLPSEKDGKSPRAVLSPGEEKATMTTTDTDTGHVTDYGSLSEGELPTHTRARRLSVGEKLVTSHPTPASSSNVEATLQAISEELARCRQLLMSKRPRESSAVQCGAHAEQRPEPTHALRRSIANRRLPNTLAPTCVFTLHIGTLVLSDEAVLNTRDKSLVLTWQFYDQSVTMTRMRAGRVVLFDFSTEYDVTFDDKFLYYMKHDEMPITVCEMDKQEHPFATCSLPLRDALLHTNRRADISLALVAGPQMQEARLADSLGAGEELGVLDMWCMLHADASLLHTINKAIARRSRPDDATNFLCASSSGVLEPIADEEPPAACLVQDLAFVRTGARARAQSNIWEQFPKFSPTSNMPTDQGTSTRMHEEEFKNWVPISANSTKADEDDISSVARQYRRRISEIPKLMATSDRRAERRTLSQEISSVARQYRRRVSEIPKLMATSLRQCSSTMIANEVPANKCNNEMRLALKRNVHEQPVSRLPKIDDEVSQVHSSIEYMKRMSAKHQPFKIQDNQFYESKEAVHDRLNREKQDSLNKTMNTKKYVKYSDTPSYTGCQRRVSGANTQSESIDITVLWLALSEECEAISDPNVKRLYVAYTFLGRKGAELETPVSLPKPKHYADKCYFNFRKTFYLHDADLPLLGHMSRCRAGRAAADPRDCVLFSVVSEPPEDPLGLSSCEDIGYAYLYLGDILAYSADGTSYTEVIPVRAARRGAVCGVLAVKVDKLDVLRRCLSMSHSQRSLSLMT